MSEVELINPPALAKPVGYSHMARVGSLLLLGGVTGMDATGAITAPGDLVAQMDLALANVVTLLAHAGAGPGQVARMRIYTSDMASYRRSLKALGEVWRRHFGRHYPAMALLGVAELFDPAALVEVECEAVLPAYG